MLTEFWHNLPASLKIVLLQGSTGGNQLLLPARLCLREAQAAAGKTAASNTMPALAREFLLAAWESDPLNGALASDALNACRDVLEPQHKNLLRDICNHFTTPPPSRLPDQSAPKGDVEQERSVILAGLHSEPDNLFWVRTLWNLGWREGDAALLEQAISRLENPLSLKSLALFLKAQLHLMLYAKDRANSLGAACPRQPELALNCLNRLDELWPTPGSWLAPLELKSLLLELLGADEESQRLGLAVLKARPWHVSLALKLYDQRFKSGLENPPPGKNVLLLYTYNKAADINRAIEALAPSTRLLYRIIVLNNGCTDNTGAVLAAWAERLGQSLEVVSLPVNIGAPAARNWLIRHDSVAAADYTIFLDDDALVCGADTGHWLKAFGRAVTRYPNAAAYGLKIIDYHAPHTNQSADLHIMSREIGPGPFPSPHLAELITSDAPNPPNLPPDAYSLNKAYSRSFDVVNPAQGAADFGLFNYIRPCASVTGCCHMFRTANLLQHGGFNLSFSPSQCDDVERDLRLAAEGLYVCYSGLGSAYHLQRTGRGKMRSPAYGSGVANHYKLSAHFSQQRVIQIMRHQFKIMEQDLLSKLKAFG